MTALKRKFVGRLGASGMISLQLPLIAWTTTKKIQKVSAAS